MASRRVVRSVASCALLVVACNTRRGGFNVDVDASSLDSATDGVSGSDARPRDSSVVDAGLSVDAHRPMDALNDARDGALDTRDARADAGGGMCTIEWEGHVGCHDPLLSLAEPSRCVPDQFPAGAVNPYRACQICRPSELTTRWTAGLALVVCGPSGVGACEVGDTCTAGRATEESCSSPQDCRSANCGDTTGTGVFTCAGGSGPGGLCFPSVLGCAAGLVCVPTEGACGPFVEGMCLAGPNPC